MRATEVHGYLGDGMGGIEVRADGKYCCVCGQGFDTVQELRTHIRSAPPVSIASMLETPQDRTGQRLVEQIDRLERVEADLVRAIAALQESREQVRAALGRCEQGRDGGPVATDAPAVPDGDPELHALDVCVQVLLPLKDHMRRRAVGYLFERWGLDH